MPAQKCNKLSKRSMIAHHLWNPEQCRFQCGCSRSHQRRLCLPQQSISLSKDYLNRNFRIQVSWIIRRFHARCTGKHQLIILCKRCSRLQHFRKIILNLLFTAAGKQGNYRLVIQTVFGCKSTESFHISFAIFIDRIHTRISHVMNRITISCKKIDFKRKNGKQFIHIPLNVLYSIFFPCPNLGRNIIVDRYLSVLLDILGDF